MCLYFWGGGASKILEWAKPSWPPPSYVYEPGGVADIREKRRDHPELSKGLELKVGVEDIWGHVE